MHDDYLLKTIDDLRKELQRLDRRLQDVRYEDFKKIAVAQIQLTLADYYWQFIESGLHEMECLPTCELRSECKRDLRGMMHEVVTDFIDDDLENALRRLEEIESLISGEDSPCRSEECRTYTTDLIRTMKLLFTLSRHIRTKMNREAEEELTQISLSSEEISRMIFPLSHPLRIDILRMLQSGEKSFSEISKNLDIKTGHLQFHLRLLQVEGYIRKSKNRGRYLLTPKGSVALELITVFSNKLSSM